VFCRAPSSASIFFITLEAVLLSLLTVYLPKTMGKEIRTGARTTAIAKRQDADVAVSRRSCTS